MEHYEKIEEKICDFKKYTKQSLDLMVDAYRWKEMANECTDENMKNKYKQISDTLFELFMTEHKNMQDIFQNN